MNYSDALSLFGFTGDFTEENLRKKYLELSKKYHPDMGGNDELMKKVNTAYDTLKVKTANYNLPYFNTLKEELQKFVSKKIYEVGSAEYKCANKINDIINSLPLTSDKNVLDLAYKSILSSIDCLLEVYKSEIYRGIPLIDKFLKRYNGKDKVETIDDYFKKVRDVKEDYDKIENTLNHVVQSLGVDKIQSISIKEIIRNKKYAMLEDIIYDKISLQDGAIQLCCEIMSLFIPKDENDTAKYENKLEK